MRFRNTSQQKENNRDKRLDITFGHNSLESTDQNGKFNYYVIRWETGLPKILHTQNIYSVYQETAHRTERQLMQITTLRLRQIHEHRNRQGKIPY